MGLRFQGNDEVDRQAKEERATWVWVFLIVLLGAVSGAVDWFTGKSLASYKDELGFYIVFGFLSWLLSPFYYEFRIRSKEIDGKVSAIEKAVTSAEEGRVELLQRLAVIEAKLDEIQRDA